MDLINLIVKEVEKGHPLGLLSSRFFHGAVFYYYVIRTCEDGSKHARQPSAKGKRKCISSISFSYVLYKLFSLCLEYVGSVFLFCVFQTYI
jgi:hypothetical protein